MPYAVCSLTCQPAPSPSTIATVRDVIDRRSPVGEQRRVVDRVGDTSDPMRTRSVTAASAGSIAQHSCVSPSVDLHRRRCSACSGRRTRSRASRCRRRPSRGGDVAQLRLGAGQIEKSMVEDHTPRTWSGPERTAALACRGDDRRRISTRPVPRPVGATRRLVDRGVHRAAPTPSTTSRSCRSRRTSWPAPTTVLDVGCGDGQISRLLRQTRRARRRHRPDLEPDRGRRRARRRAALRPRRGRRLPFADAQFDAVVACLVFEHIDDRRRGDRRGRPCACARRAVQLLPQPPAAADAGQRLDRRPDARPARAVLADRCRTSSRPRPIEEVEQGVYIRFLHRPLSRYVNTLIDHGFVLERMVEPAPPPGSSRWRPSTPGRRRSRACCISVCDARRPS